MSEPGRGDRPRYEGKYVVVVLAILVFLLGAFSARRMSTDILPVVDIPAVNIIWTYAGLNAPEMVSKIT